MKRVYLLLTRSQTYVGRFIHLMTGDEYTHVSLALDRDLARLYSFGRKYMHFALPGGFIPENIHGGIYRRYSETQCLIYELPVSEEVYDQIERHIRGMLTRINEYRYNLLGVVLCQMDIAHVRSRHYFCSQFVADTLEKGGAVRLPKPASLMRPNDFRLLPGLRRVYCGPLCQYSEACGDEPLPMSI